MDFKKGDYVVIIGRNNRPEWGGVIGNLIGMVYTITEPDKMREGNYCVSKLGYTIHNSQMHLLARRDRNGKLRDARGHFTSKPGDEWAVPQWMKNAATAAQERWGEPAPKVKEVVKEAPAKKPEPLFNYDHPRLGELRKTLRAKEVTFCCGFALINYVGGEEYHASAPCHAQLRYKNGVQALVESVNMHVDKLARHGITKDDFKEVISWCLNESHFSKVFLTKDVEEAFEKGVVVDVNAPGNMMFASLVAMRGFSEFPRQTLGWRKLVAKGVKPMVAWAVAASMSESNGVWVLESNSNAHRIFGTASTSMEAMRKFIKTGEWKTPGGAYRTNSYSGAEVPTFGGNGYEAKASIYNVCANTKLITDHRAGQFGAVTRGVKDEDILEFCKLFEGE